MKSLIDRYKRYQKLKYFSKKYSKDYVFVGIGGHSLSNLYPVLDYLNIPLKYIITASEQTSEHINKVGWKISATSDYDSILKNENIEGVFISAKPEAHYTLVKKALQNNKNVFVEKPPCSTLEELDELISIQKASNKIVLVGLQRRYAPAYTLLKKKAKNIEHYSLKYCIGAYPEGNRLLDLFIHPLDSVVYLFGEAQVISKIETNNTLLIQLQHKNGIIGSLELSTAYTWQDSHEELIVVCKNGILELINISDLVFKSKPPVIASIPLEKIIKFTPKAETLFHQNKFLPVIQQNNLYINGYFSEIETFVQLCEGKTVKNQSDLSMLRQTYLLMGSLQ